MSERPIWYDFDEQPHYDIESMSSAWGDPRWRVAQTTLQLEDESVWISTVFLFFDYDWMSDGPPVLYETMVFGGPDDEDQWHWHTRTEARAGHDRIVAELRKRYGLSDREAAWEAKEIAIRNEGT